ncbi:MAG TPA: hypothetical protein VF406_04255 [Thermodesulfobacteriota bacterium]
MAGKRQTRRPARRRGVALITILLMLFLAAAIGLMVLTVSETESQLASTNRRTTQTLHGAGGGADTAIPVIRSVVDANAIPSFPASVEVDTSNTTGNAAIDDFVEELTGGPGGDDTVQSKPDITLAGVFPSQTVRVDVDYAGQVSLPGSEVEEFAAGYHKKTGGAGCASGSLYYVDSLSQGVLRTQSRVGQAYFMCP